jgi:hypothetical protein
MSRRIVVGFSGGVTSAWCAGWALRTFPQEEVILLFHDTKGEHPDTYRFIREMGEALGHPIVERSDGRDVFQVFEDEGFLGNNQNAMCSRILKLEQSDQFIAELKSAGHDVVKVLGFSKGETERIQRMTARAARDGYEVRYPLAEQDVSKQTCVDWCQLTMKVCPSEMYLDFEHANCIGCVKGGMAYWMKVREKFPETFHRFARLEREYGHNILRGGGAGRKHYWLDELPEQTKRKVYPREAVTIGPCECGD